MKYIKRQIAALGCVLALAFLGAAPALAAATPETAALPEESLETVEPGSEQDTGTAAAEEALSYTDEGTGTVLYYTVADGCAAITGCDDENAVGALVLPAELGGCPVTAIGPSAFYLCSGLTSVTLPDTVTSIGDSAFYACSGVTEFTLPAALQSVGGAAFAECRALTAIALPDSVATLGRSVFSGCESLREVTLPEGLTVLPYATFYGCLVLPEVSLPQTVTEIGENAFFRCTALYAPTLPEGLLRIGSGAFAGCAALEELTLPTTLTQVGPRAFYGCDALTDAWYGGTAAAWSAVTVGEGNDALESAVHFPVAQLLFDANGGSVERATQVVYKNLAGQTLPTPQRAGYSFSGWYTAKTDGDRIANIPYDGMPEDLTLYAHWTALEYLVRFHANGGSVGTASMRVAYRSRYGTLPTPARTGYAFAGWYTAKTGGVRVTATTVMQATATQTLYARWTARNYLVRFHANSGSVSTASIRVAYGSRYGTLPTPTRTGYAFIGWYTAKTGGKKVTASSLNQTAGTQTLYARWTTAG